MPRLDRFDTVVVCAYLLFDGIVVFAHWVMPILVGRWLAMSEIQMFVVTFLATFDITPVGDAFPESSPLHLVGSQEPATPFHVNVQKLL